MSSKQRLITDVFAQHKKDGIRSAKAKSAPVINEPVVLDDDELQQLLREREIDVLKQFDLRWEYGPCTGISRLERWERAEKHGMNPPEEVRQLIENNKDQEEYTHSLWHNYPL